MRTRTVWLAAILLMGFLGFNAGHAQDVPNLLANGGFESGNIGPYGTYGSCTTEIVTNCVGAAVPEGPVEGKNCLHIVVPAAGANNWDVGMTDGSHTFQKGKKYTFSCFMKTKSGTLQVRLKPERGADPWEGYGEAVVTVTDTWQEFTVTTPVFSADVTPASPTFHFAFAPGDFWMDGVRLYEGDYVPPAFKKRFSAQDPAPEDEAVDVPREAILSWGPGPFAAKHNVYLGATFEDVNNAEITSPGGALVSQDQTATTYDPESLLEFGKTYYWRVDEVNAPPDATIYKGEVWSFTAEPFAYPIGNIIATASSSEKPENGPDETVNGSGLSGDLHSTATANMWLNSKTDPGPIWIQYQFDRAYKLYELQVWNFNGEFEPVLGYGFKDVTVEHSVDGVTWTVLGDVQFAQATAQDEYAPNTTVDLGGAMAQYVRLTANSNWSAVGLKQYGLSEVRFLEIPVVARGPSPAVGTQEVALDMTLSWRPGREAVSHEVYFSSNEQAVIDGTALVGTVGDNSFVPDRLEYGVTYFWKVTEVGEAADSVYAGDVWSFASIEYFVVDDLETYTDEEGGRIYEAWIDGWTNNTGSTVGYLQAPFAEKVIVHGGEQSMPIDFNNTISPFYSEAERTFDSVQDWTVEGVTQLIVWFRGDGANTAGPLYVAIKDSGNKTAVAVHPNPDAVTRSVWSEWRILLSDLAGVNLAKVKTMYIGVGDRNNPKPNGAGMLYIDDIRVGRPATPPDGSAPEAVTNLLANPGFESGVLAPWNVYGNATPQVVTALTGAAVPENVIEGTYCLYVDVAAGIANFWEAGLQPTGEVFEKGKKYTVSAFLKSKQGTLDVNFKPELGADPWTGYGEQMMTITEEWAEYSVTTPVFTEDVNPASFTFHIGSAVGGFWVDAVRFYEGDYVPPGAGQ